MLASSAEGEEAPHGARQGVAWRFQPESVAALCSAIVIGALALLPIGYLCWRTLVPAGRLSIAAFSRAYDDPLIGDTIANTLLFALAATVLAVVLGTGLAYLVARTDLPLRGLIFAAAIGPLAIPGVLYAISWIFLASPRSGLLNRLLEPLSAGGALDVFSLGGMAFVEGLHLSPLVFLLMYAVFRSLDPHLEESALASGASLATAFRRITLRLVAPALSAAVLITAIRALEAFEVPTLLGVPARRWVLTSRIWDALGEFPPDFGQAGALALSLLVVTAGAVAFHSRLAARGRRFETIGSARRRSPRLRLGRGRWPLFALTVVYALVALALPLLILVYVSLQRFYAGVTLHGFATATLANYRSLRSDSQVRHALANSLLLGTATATIVVLGTVVVSWVVLRSNVRGRRLLDLLVTLPIAVPGMVLGLAVLVIYLRVPLGIYGTLWILLIAWVTRAMPYGMRYVSASMAQVGRELEESAHVSGAGWWQTLRRVLLPLVLPGMLAGWLATFIVSLRELSSSLVVYSPGREVLSITIWNEYANGQLTQLAALGVAMVLSLGLLTAVLYRIASRLGVMEA